MIEEILASVLLLWVASNEYWSGYDEGYKDGCNTVDITIKKYYDRI